MPEPIAGRGRDGAPRDSKGAAPTPMPIAWAYRTMIPGWLGTALFLNART